MVRGKYNIYYDNGISRLISEDKTAKIHDKIYDSLIKAEPGLKETIFCPLFYLQFEDIHEQCSDLYLQIQDGLMTQVIKELENIIPKLENAIEEQKKRSRFGVTFVFS